MVACRANLVNKMRAIRVARYPERAATGHHDCPIVRLSAPRPIVVVFLP
jgi:hypothetical protein